MTEKEKIRTSKFISLVLRHNPKAANVKMDSEGWVNVTSLLIGLREAGYPISRSDLIDIVTTDDKQRYSFDKFKANIRANQGHSINVDLKFVATNPPAELYHGTANRFLESIFSEGLKPMSRQYVHLSKDKQTAEKVGSRHGKCVILVIDTESMVKDGYEFYLSDNGVWLTKEVPIKYIRRVNYENR